MPSPAFPVPDLRLRRSRPCASTSGRLRQMLVFAFATGASQEAFDGALAKAKLPPSSWRPRELRARPLPRRDRRQVLRGPRRRHAVRRLHALPRRAWSRSRRATPRDVDLRREVLARARRVADEARRQLERVYAAIVRLRTLLCARGSRRRAGAASRSCGPRARSSTCSRAASRGRRRRSGACASSAPPSSPGTDTAGSSRCSSTRRTRPRSTSTSASARTARCDRCRSSASARTATTRSTFRCSRRFLVRFVLFFRGYRTTSGEVAERVLSDVLTARRGRGRHLLSAPRRPRGVPRSARLPRPRGRRVGCEMALPEMVPQGEALEVEGLFNPLLLAVRRHADAVRPAAWARARSSS